MIKVVKREKKISNLNLKTKSRSTHTQFVGLYQCLPHSNLCAKYLPILNNRHKILDTSVEQESVKYHCRGDHCYYQIKPKHISIQSL